MTDDWGQRKIALKIGATYHVMSDANGFSGLRFSKGEEVRFQSVGYVPYDNAFVYIFETSEGEKAYWLRDHEPLAQLSAIFVRKES